MKTHILERTQIIERSLTATFEFFSDADNLEKLTPQFLQFKILTPRPITMKSGTLIDYSLSLFGLPFKWQTLIEIWEPGVRFVDSQVKGPYELWHHTHTFEALGAERTLMKDQVQYQLPLGFLGELAHLMFVKTTLHKIFAYRAEVTARLLAPQPQSVSILGRQKSGTSLIREAGE